MCPVEGQKKTMIGNFHSSLCFHLATGNTLGSRTPSPAAIPLKLPSQVGNVLFHLCSFPFVQNGHLQTSLEASSRDCLSPKCSAAAISSDREEGKTREKTSLLAQLIDWSFWFLPCSGCFYTWSEDQQLSAALEPFWMHYSWSFYEPQNIKNLCPTLFYFTFHFPAIYKPFKIYI